MMTYTPSHAIRTLDNRGHKKRTAVEQAAIKVLVFAAFGPSLVSQGQAQTADVNFPSISVKCDLAIDTLIVSKGAQAGLILSIRDIKTGTSYSGDLKATFWEATAAGSQETSRTIKAEPSSTYTPPLFEIQWASWRIPVQSLSNLKLTLCRT